MLFRSSAKSRRQQKPLGCSTKLLRLKVFWPAMAKMKTVIDASGGCGSKLHYSRTREEVRLGDRVRLKRWLRKDLLGVVCYIPGPGTAHPDLDVPEEGFHNWAIRLDDGDFLLMLYAPDRAQPRSNIEFVSRGVGVNLQPDERVL